MAPAILLAVIGLAMLCQGLLKWRTEGKRLALVGAAMMLASACVYFVGQGNMPAAFVCGSLLAASLLTALTTAGRSWAKPEVILGITAVGVLLASTGVTEPSTQSTLALAAAACGLVSIVLALRSVLAGILASPKG